MKTMFAIFSLIALTLVCAIVSLLLGCSAAHADDLTVSIGQAMWRGTAPAAAIDYTDGILPGFGWDIGEVYIGAGQYRGCCASDYIMQYGKPNWITRGMLTGTYGRLTVGAGPSYMTAPWPFNGQTYNFSLLGAIRLTSRLSVTYNHFSDAGMTKRNLGRDLLELTWRF